MGKLKATELDICKQQVEEPKLIPTPRPGLIPLDQHSL